MYGEEGRRVLSRSASTASLVDMVANSTPETSSLIDGRRDIEQARYGSVPAASYRDKITLKERAQYYVPGLKWIPEYKLTNMPGDILAGCTVASILIPQAVSYASSLAKMSPVTGLFSASIPGIVYAFLGTSKQLNVAPEAALSLLIGQAVQEVLHEAHFPGDPEKVSLQVATIITFQVGVISFMLGFLRLGFIDVVLSRALLRGFITAVGVVILVEQLIPMFGLVALARAADPHTTLDKMIFLVGNVWTHLHPTTTLISCVALAALLTVRTVKNLSVFKRFWFIYRIPEVLVVVVVSTILSSKFRWDEEGVVILGSVEVSTGSLIQLPFRASNLKYLRTTTSTAVLISIIGFLDSIVSAKQTAAKYAHTVSPNRELVALGAANLAGSFFPGTLPAYGSITRSRINGEVGARTQLASLVTSALVLLATFFLLPWLYFLPKCVLGAVICLVVYSLLAEAPHDLMFYFRMRAWMDLSLMASTFVFSIVWNVEVGILSALVISLLLVVRRSSKTRVQILGRIPGTDKWKPINENPEAEEDVSGALILRIRENLDFANTAQLKERLRRLELYGAQKSHPAQAPRRAQATALVFHMSDVDECDASAIQIFSELLTTYKTRKVGLFIAHLKPGPRKTFEAGGIVDLLGPENFFESVGDAMARVGVAQATFHD